MIPADVSVVIATLNEAKWIEDCVRSAVVAGAGQIIVSDGGSSDETRALAKAAGATELVSSAPGRGLQLNAGSARALGRVILFLHADSRLGAYCLEQICQQAEPLWGAFRQQIDSSRSIYRWIERGNAWRVKMRSMPFGDQGVFVARELFEQQGRFAEIPLMEDVEFAKRLRQVAKPMVLPGPITISARRWEQNGAVRQTLRNWLIQAAYQMGVSADKLAKHYRPNVE